MQKSIVLSDHVALSPVVAGCMRIAGSALSDADILRFVEQCLDMGVSSFDHAPVYGAYTVEERFGNAVLRKNQALRDKMTLISKTGIVLPQCDANNERIYYKATRQWIVPEVERSLQKLGTDYLDVLLVHRYDPLANPAELGAVLDELVQSGKTKTVGVSNYSAAAFSALQSHMKNPLVTNQVELSAVATDLLFDGFCDDALQHDLPLMAWSPLGGGRIFTEEDEQNLRLREALSLLAKCHNVGMDTLLYAFLFRLPQRVAAVSGTMKIERMKAAVEGLNLELSYDEWYAILAAARGFDVP